MKTFARLLFLTIFLCLPMTAHAQETTEETSSGKPFYGYAGWAGLAFGALYGACRASRR